MLLLNCEIIGVYVVVFFPDMGLFCKNIHKIEWSIKKRTTHKPFIVEVCSNVKEQLNFVCVTNKKACDPRAILCQSQT